MPQVIFALIPIIFLLCISGVLILRPLTTRLGLLIETVVQERQARPPAAGDPRLTQLIASLEQLGGRVERMEERLGFVERLVESREPRPLPQVPQG